MDEVHKPEKHTKNITELKIMARKVMEFYLTDARNKAIEIFSSEHTHVGIYTQEERENAIKNLDFIIFEVPEHQFGQDTDASESVLERLRREFEDLIKAPLEEVAGKVGMLGGINFHQPDEAYYNEMGLAEIGCVSIEDILDNRICMVHFEIGVKERIGREARFELFEDLPRKNELRSIPDAFKEIVRILEEQGKMIPKI